MAGPSETPKRRWLKWAGLQEPPPDPEAWAVVVTDIRIDNPATGASDIAAGIVEFLRRAGIDAQQRVYLLPDEVQVHGVYGPDWSSGRDAVDRLRASVLVHNRDLERATGLSELQQELDRWQTGPLSHDELTRQSLEAGAELERRTIEGG